MSNSRSVFSSYFSKKTKTSAEIISEAKASVHRKESPHELHFMRPLSTKRPFTPRQKERYSSYDKNFSGSIEGGDVSRPHSGIKLEPLVERPASSKESTPKFPAISNAPSASSTSSTVRQQFRLQLVKEEEETLSEMCQSLLKESSQDEHDQTWARVKKKIQEEPLTERDLRHILKLLEPSPEFITLILNVLLPKINEENKRKTSFRLTLFRSIFQLSKNDSNDDLFVENENFLPHFLTAMGLGDPLEESEVLIYGYGAIKFLSMNSIVLSILEKHGFVDLLVLHLKLIAKFLRESGPQCSPDHLQHLLFQMTASLRNALNTKTGRKKLKVVKGLPELEVIFKYCMGDPDVICNLSRILSVMSADDEVCDAFLECISLVNVTLEALFKYSNRSEVVVRLAYSLGNLLGQYDEIRKYIYDKRFEEGQPDLFDRLSQLLLSYSKHRTKYDVAIKIIRIFANTSINPEAGSEMALCPILVESVLNVLEVNTECAAIDLLISCVSTLNNLSFYPIFSHAKVYEKLIPKYSFHEDLTLATESMRVLGNLSRITEIRNSLVEEGHFEALLDRIPSRNKDYDYSTYGVMVNMMVDSQTRPLFRKSNGFQKSLDILEEGIRDEDYDLCTLVCQALWNYSIDLNPCHIDPEEIADLNDILSVVIYQKQEGLLENIEEDEDFCDLYSMAQGLLIRYNKIISSENGETSCGQEKDEMVS